MHVKTVTDIQAPPEVVWELLADPAQWSRWTPSIRQAWIMDGPAELRLGQRVRISQPGLRPAVWTVTAYREGVTYTWVSVSGGVSTLATHTVVPKGSGSRLLLKLRQDGLLAPVVSLLAGGRVRRYVALEAAGLRAEAERRAHAGAAT